MARHTFIPRGVAKFRKFYLRPVTYFSDPEVQERLGVASNAGLSNLLNVRIPALIAKYEDAYNHYKSLIGTNSQRVAHQILIRRQEQLGDAYSDLRDALNNNFNRTIADNDGSGLPTKNTNRKRKPAPVMNDSYPVVSDIRRQLAQHLVMTFYDSGDGEKRARRPRRQLGAIFVCLITDLSDPAPTLEEVLAKGRSILATRSPFSHNFGAKNAGKRLSYVAYWMNTRNQPGMVGELFSLILA